MNTTTYTTSNGSASHKETRPWFKAFPTDILGSTELNLLSNAAYGVHFKLLLNAWTEIGVPADPELLRRLTHSDRDEWNVIWPELEPLWLEDAGRRYNAFLERLREKTSDDTERQRARGKKSAEARQAKAGTADPRANRTIAPGPPPPAQSTPRATSEIDDDGVDLSAFEDTGFYHCMECGERHHGPIETKPCLSRSGAAH